MTDEDRTILSGSSGRFAAANTVDRTTHGGPSAAPALQADQTVLSGLGAAPDPARSDADQATVLASPETLAHLAAVKRSSSSEEGPLNVGQAFGNRYHIIRLLGIGGMGAVYQAWDDELAVAVAIKVIRPEVMADPHAAAEIEKRFKRELLLARQVTHKNVVRIHDLGEISGIKYITMPYIEGADLSTVLRKEGRLPAARTLRIARSVVAGLIEAHKKDIVHRDLKPANIMIDANDEAMIMDFGIARSTGQPVAGPMPGNTTIVGDLRRVASAPDATVLGAVIGTVEYMAPEQARGEHVDQRADVYAFGLIMYDMLTGRPRAQHMGSAVAELQARMVQAPPHVKSFVPDTPTALDGIVSRCLEPDPAKRFQTSQELADALGHLDEQGNPIRVKRVVGVRLFAAVLTLVVAALGTTWWFTRGPAVPVEHDPVTLLIADFQNSSKDPTFDHTLEPVLKLALEGAQFISAYDRAGLRTTGARAPEKLDEVAAQQIAVKQGLGVVVSGSIERQGSGYGISVKALQPVTGNVIATARDKASSKDDVIDVTRKLANTIRKALGDNTSDDRQRFAKDTLSTTSLDAIREYSAGMIANSNSQFEVAKASFTNATKLDPKFGMAYAAMAMMAYNLDKQQEAEAYVKTAFENLDGMTERERYRTRGMYYMLTNDDQQCAKEYGELVARYKADASARNNLALCLTHLRQMDEAVQHMQQVVSILPNRPLYRQNLALFADYAGDFETAEKEAGALADPGVFGTIAIAFAQMGQGQIPQATETYQKLAKIDAQGASYAASGLADIAVYEGRFSDAAHRLEAGAAADLAAKDPDRAAAKFAALAQVQLLRQQKAAALAAVDKALANSQTVKIRFLAARVFVEAGEAAKAQKLGAGLSAELQPTSQAYGRIIDGEAALKKKDPRAAIKALTEANTLLDTWIGRFDLGRAYLDAEQFPQADSEFDRCVKRRGEGLALFLDEEPTFGYTPVVYYYQGRVRQGLKSAGFAEPYRKYLDIRGKSTEDPLVPQTRKQIPTQP